MSLKESKYYKYSGETLRDKTQRALQEIELEGLAEIDRICRKHNIEYSLGGGTCLGQLRHNGFIPWDDDIDVDMTIENYKKFCEVAKTELDSHRFFLRCRDTDPTHYRTCSRLEMLNTRLSLPKWSKKNMTVGVFVDIFVWSYLPNNKFLRKIVSSSLFYLRCIENQKMFHAYARKANPFLRIPIKILSYILPLKFVYWLEYKFSTCTKGKKTNWIIDDAIINGNHGGYYADGIDEYKDVKFGNLIVRNKKNPDFFMRTIYGDGYMDWLPPASRISHHTWSGLSFGVYEEKFDLPENYYECLTVKYTQEKLEHMQKLTLDMISSFDSFCTKNKISYFIIGELAEAQAFDVEESVRYWTSPGAIAMPRADYDKLIRRCSRLGDEFFFQTKESDKEYKNSYGRLRLKLTSIHEGGIPKKEEEKYENGFFINVIPLDNAPDNKKSRVRFARKVRYLNHFIRIKKTKRGFKNFRKSGLKMKIKIMILWPFSINTLLRKLDKTLKKYSKDKTDYYVDSSGYNLPWRTIAKDYIKDIEQKELFGYKGRYLARYREYLENCSRYDTRIAKKVVKLDNKEYLKKEHFVYYDKICSYISEKKIKSIQKKFPTCYLTYYDLPEHQLSILRYDEKTGKYLSNDEILNKYKEEF